MNDPFADPTTPPSTFPNQGSFRGRLVMITPVKIETVPNNMNPGQTQERITANVTVVDGAGPVPLLKNNVPTGQFLEGPDFTGVWFSGQRLVTQMRDFVGTGRAVLGTIDTYQPGQTPMKGNPWGLNAATPEQKQAARNFLATRTVSAAMPPSAAPVAPQQAASPVAPQQAAPAPSPAPVSPAAPPAVPAPGSAPVGANPFA